MKEQSLSDLQKIEANLLVHEFWHISRISRRRGCQPGYLRQCRHDLVVFLLENSLFATDYFCLRLQVTFALGLQYRGGPRNMKPMRPPPAAICFMTYFYRAGGDGPFAPLHPLLV